MSGVLFLAHRCPYPPDRGDRMRSWNIVKALAEHAPVHVIALAGDLAVPQPLADVCASVTLIPHQPSKRCAMGRALVTGTPASVQYFASDALHTAVDGLLRCQVVDVIYAFSGQMAQFVPPKHPGVSFIMDFVDVDSAKFEEIAKASTGFRKWAHEWEACRLRNFEAAAAKHADLNLFVSEAEAALFRQRTGLIHERVKALSNGVDLEHYQPRARSRHSDQKPAQIVFTGQMDYHPNVDAVCYFARAVMPLIRQEKPDARFAIVGRAPKPEVLALNTLPGVIVTGEVPDTRPWLADADCVVAPLKIARGIQNKVLEAMAMAKPVMASSQAAEGLAITHGLEAMIADDAQSEAAAVLQILNDPAAAATMGCRARRHVEQHFAWPVVTERLGLLMEAARGKGHAA